MRKWMFSLLVVLPVWAVGQTSGQVETEISIPSVVSAPSSSVDLLQKSTKDASPFAVPSSKKPPKIPAAPTLDMPLPVGGSSATVQAVVAPARTGKTTRTKRTKGSKVPSVTTVVSTAPVAEQAVPPE